MVEAGPRRDRRGMATRGAVGRKRCRVCRNWFVPGLSARETQKLCGEAECRRAWRAGLERVRLAAADDERREYERQRKRDWREKSQEARAGPAESLASPAASLTGPAMSLTGLGADSPAGKPIRGEIWDKAVKVSLAGLARDLARIQGEVARIVGQVGQDSGDVPDRPRARICGRARRSATEVGTSGGGCP